MSNLFAGIRWVWMNGQLVEFEKATVHVLSHALHYGSGVFEGIRCYDTADGPAVFRLREHIRRLEKSSKIYRMPLRFSAAELADAVCETILANDLGACYIRPLVYRGFGTLGVDPLRSPVDVAIAAWRWGKYLGDQGEDVGVDVCVSSWPRVAPDALPAVAKATGNYLNAQLVKVEALTNGYAEGIALDASGYVSEGSGQNLFLVHGGTLVTPPATASLLPGITRDTVITLARDLGIPVREGAVSRGELYLCDELFMTGTAVEIAPVRSVDKIPVGDGRPGEVTRRIIAEFKSITSGRTEDRHGWLAAVAQPARKPVAVESK